MSGRIFEVALARGRARRWKGLQCTMLALPTFRQAAEMLPMVSRLILVDRIRCCFGVCRKANAWIKMTF